jgi:cytochrome c-type biogenesis protein
MTVLALAFLAGLLTSLSPCVLPVLPLVVGGAMSQHRLGPLALCAGLSLSFSLLGALATLATQAFGFDPILVRSVGAVMLLLFGLALLIPRAQEWSSTLLAPLASRAGSLTTGEGLWGNLFAGAMLGAVWSPCSGPTLGAAIGLATQAGTVLQGFALMLVFGLAASLPLLTVAYGARTAFLANRNRLARLMTRAKPIFGVVLILVSLSILSGWDKRFETAVVNRLPAHWVDIMTKF